MATAMPVFAMLGASAHETNIPRMQDSFLKIQRALFDFIKIYEVKAASDLSLSSALPKTKRSWNPSVHSSYTQRINLRDFFRKAIALLEARKNHIGSKWREGG
jgi:hypothetical protein